MGLNLAGLVQSDYIGRRSILKIKKKVEKKLRQRAGCEDLIYDVITKDKFYSNSVFNANGLPCIENLALISCSGLIYPNGKKEEIDSILKLTFPFFIKNITLEAGEGTYSCKNVNGNIEVNGEVKDLRKFLGILGNKKWVIQRKYISNTILLEVNSSALNTTRIVTILNHQEPEFLCGFQGFATGNATADSWSHGSVYVGIDLENECLKETGITSVSDKREGQIIKHPDSGVVFKNYKIPFLKQAVDLCLRAHRVLYFNFIIGWDVAITDSGPLIVEANEKPGMNVAQALNGGMKQKIVENAAKVLKE